MKQIETEEMNEMEIRPLQLLKALWHRAWLIVLITVLVGALAFGYSKLFITPMYRASTMLYVNNSSTAGSTSVTSSDLSAAKSLVSTYGVVVKTRDTLETVVERANLNYTYETLRGMVSSKSVDGTEVFELIVEAPNPDEAALIANTIAELMPERIPKIVEGSSVCIVDYAVAPTEKSSPNIPRNTVLGMLIGFVLSCVAVILLNLFDEQIRGEEYLRQTYNLPILAVIPDLLATPKGGYYKYGETHRSDSSGKKAKR